VEKFATITPRVVRFKGKPGVPLQSSVKIIPEKKYPFSITSVSAKNGKMIRFRLKTLEKNGEKGYLLTIENLKKSPGGYFDVISLATDSKIQPEIKINVLARLTDTDTGKEQNRSKATGNSFLQLIQKMQKQKASGKENSSAPAETRNPEQSEKLKKQFEALIKQAQKDNK